MTQEPLIMSLGTQSRFRFEQEVSHLRFNGALTAEEYRSIVLRLEGCWDEVRLLYKNHGRRTAIMVASYVLVAPMLFTLPWYIKWTHDVTRALKNADMRVRELIRQINSDLASKGVQIEMQLRERSPFHREQEFLAAGQHPCGTVPCHSFQRHGRCGHKYHHAHERHAPHERLYEFGFIIVNNPLPTAPAKVTGPSSDYMDQPPAYNLYPPT